MVHKLFGGSAEPLFYMITGALIITGISYILKGIDIKHSIVDKQKEITESRKRVKKYLKDLENAKSTAKENTLKSKMVYHDTGVSIEKPYIDISSNQMVDKGTIYPGSLDELDSVEFPYGNNFAYYYLDKENREELATHLSFAAKRKPRKIGTGTYQHTTSNAMDDSNHVFSIIGDKY